MIIRFKNKAEYEAIDRLIEKYYEGMTSVEEEKRLQAFLSRTGLPEKYAPEQAIWEKLGLDDILAWMWSMGHKRTILQDFQAGIKTLIYYQRKSGDVDRKSTRLNSSHRSLSRMPSSA